MRVLIALDGSPQADRARALAASIAWPTGTVIEVIAVARSLPAVGFHDPDRSPRDAGRAELETVVADAAAMLSTDGATVRSSVLAGRPATAIVDAAAQLRADLVIVGSRGFGPIPTMVLGSVSAEVADHAPCPVLVARCDGIDSLVLGTDGSETAQAAVDFLAGFRFLEDRPVDVLSVVPSPAPLIDPLGGIGMGMYGAGPDASSRTRREERDEYAAFAGRAAEQLHAAGYDVRPDVREGDAAHVLIEAALQRDQPLVVVGTHGRTGLTRAVLGSVARNVLLHAPCSVLIVRGPVRERDTNRVTSPAAALLVGAL